MFDYPIMSNPLIAPFSRVMVIVTLGALPNVLIDGIITHIQLDPSSNPRESTLTITGEDIGVMMDIEEKRETHPNQPDPVIVTKIIASYAKFGLIPKVIPPLSMDIPLMIDRIPSQHSTDLSYIIELAHRYGYVFYIEPQAPGINIAYWGPPNFIGIPQKALSVNMDPETNVTSINFQYNALRPTMINGRIQDRITNIILPVKTVFSTRPPLSSKPAWFVNKPNVSTKQFRQSGLNMVQALGRAQAETDMSQDVLVVNGELDSLQYDGILKARKLVGLRGTWIFSRWAILRQKGYSQYQNWRVQTIIHACTRGIWIEYTCDPAMNQDAKLFFGKYRGKVTNNMDLLGQGRICANVPAVFGEKETGWALPSVPYAGNGVGMFFIPPIGANVWIEFEAGCPEFPIWSGCFWGVNEAPKPPLPQVKMIKQTL